MNPAYVKPHGSLTTLLFAALTLAAAIPQAAARTCMNAADFCLFQLARATPAPVFTTWFAILPEIIRARPALSGSNASFSAENAEIHQPDAAPAPALDKTRESATASSAGWLKDWPCLQSLHLWSDEAEPFFSHALGGPRSTMGIGYSDIFETGCDPTKGGHGISFVFRHSFLK